MESYSLKADRLGSFANILISADYILFSIDFVAVQKRGNRQKVQSTLRMASIVRADLG